MESSAGLLAIDDRSENLYVLKQVLTGSLPDCEFLGTTNADEGLELARTRRIDGVLIDINMPGIGGIELCRRLKNDPKTQRLPILLITSQQTTSDLRIAGLEAGADDLITRPIANEELIARIGVMLRIKRAEDELRQLNRRLEAQVAERTVELQMRNRIATAFLTQSDDRAYDELLAIILEATKSPYGVFGYLDASGDLVCPTMTREVWERCRIADKTVRFPRESWGGVWGRALRSRKTEISDGSMHVPEGHIPLTRALAVPVVYHDAAIGLITAANKATEYDDYDRSLTEAIATFIAPILAARLERDQADAVRRRAMDEREGLIRQVVGKNSELEQFLYGVSHDLKSPLITIRGFLTILEQEVAGGDGGRASEYIRRVLRATEHMQELLDQLLMLSRVGRIENFVNDVALGVVASQVIEVLEGRLATKNVRIHIHDDLPTVQGDPARLKEVLQNLVENALKYLGDSPDAEIEIGSRRDGETTVCYVRDTGIGIEPNHHDRVFNLFEKLDPKSEGTGVGLAIVKRIIESHGGRIWVESEGAGHGSTFCFTLPGTTQPGNELVAVGAGIDESPEAASI